MKRYDFKEVEDKILAKWKSEDTYTKVASKNKGKEKFYFLQGPPYTSGRLHIGHAWNNAMKDIILRYKRMKGFDVWDRAGYDMHGLPTENKVQAKLNLKTKEDIKEYGMDKFIQECKKFSEENALQMDEDLFRLGIWMDYKNAYWPIKNYFIEGEWLLIKKAHEQDRLYKGKKVMTWCKDCETALAKHELEYEEVTDNSIFLKFKLEGTENEYLVIWTTTPWTIPFNLAVMVNPEIDYVKAKVENEVWIVAKALVGPFINGVVDKQFEIIDEFKGTALEGRKYIHPFKDKIDFGHYDKLHTVLLSQEYVDTTSGSGLVHCAPGCGPEDYEVGARNGLPAFNMINERGEFQIEAFKDLVAKKDDKAFIKLLQENGSLIASTPVEHEYPHCWRCHNGVVFRATEQWFLKTEDLSKDILKFNQDVNWVPEESNKSFKLWVENLKDNSITRQRFWGCPVPIWECECGHIEVIGNAKELKEKAGDIPEDLHRPYIDEVKIKCSCGKDMSRIPDVLDVWIDSGTASWNCLEYPARDDYIDRLFPADLVLEATEQTRLWFTMLQMCSAIAFGKSAYKNVYTHGMILDYQGMKMSKSLGNIISPYEVVDKHGADVMRYYICQTSAGKNINFSWDDVKLKERNLNVLWNVQNYLIDLHTQIKDVDIAEKGIEERYIISKLNSTIKKVEELFEKYELDSTIGLMEEFFLELSRTYIQMIRDKASMGSDEEKKLIYETIKECMLGILKMFSTISPYICEEIYLNLKDIFGTDEKSVHLLSWPNYDDKQIDEELEENIDISGNIIQAGLAGREKAGISLRWPIKEIIVQSDSPHIERVLEAMDDVIKNQLNVKEISLNKEIELNYSVKVNYKNAGKKFGQELPSVIAKIAEFDGTDIVNDIKKDGKFMIGDKEVTFDDIIYEKIVPEEYKAGEFAQGTVFVNTIRTKELELEGFSREVMRKVQALRKDKGLEKKDRIKLHLKTEFDDIDLYSEHIKDKCGADSITISDLDSEMDNVGNLEVKGKKFTIFFNKI